jgi:tetratricopeptide (TPR) repeat protein
MDCFLEADQVFRKAAKINLNDPLLNKYWGSAAYNLYDFPTAIGRFQIALPAFPDDYETLTALGSAYVWNDQAAEALPLLEKAIQLSPQFAPALNAYGNALRETGKPEDALAWHDKALAASPDYDGAKLGKGLTLAKLGRKDEAKALLEAYAQAYPDDTRMLKVIDEALK